MVLNWIDHPSYRRDEQLMHVLFECGMATFEQLKGITGWTERAVKRQIKNLQKRAKDSQASKQGDDLRKEDQWIISHRLSRPYGKSQVVYTLGRPSLHYVHEMRQEENKKIKDPPFGQAMHFIGINEILVRSLHEFGREQVSWLSTQHVTDLFLLSQQQDSTLDRRNMIRPDARLSIGAVHYYIEFDNDTEMPRQLERKFHRYVQTLQAIRDHSTPVLWITTNPKRKDYLKRNWEAIKRKYYAAQPVPDMHFFVQGDEMATIREHSIQRD